MTFFPLNPTYSILIIFPSSLSASLHFTVRSIYTFFHISGYSVYLLFRPCSKIRLRWFSWGLLYTFTWSWTLAKFALVAKIVRLSHILWYSHEPTRAVAILLQCIESCINILHAYVAAENYVFSEVTYLHDDVCTFLAHEFSGLGDLLKIIE